MGSAANGGTVPLAVRHRPVLAASAGVADHSPMRWQSDGAGASHPERTWRPLVLMAARSCHRWPACSARRGTAAGGVSGTRREARASSPSRNQGIPAFCGAPVGSDVVAKAATGTRPPPGASFNPGVELNGAVTGKGPPSSTPGLPGASPYGASPHALAACRRDARRDRRVPSLVEPWLPGVSGSGPQGRTSPTWHHGAVSQFSGRGCHDAHRWAGCRAFRC